MAKRILIIAVALIAAASVVVGALWFAGSLDLSRSGDRVATVNGPTTEKDDDFGSVTVYAVLDDGSLEPAADGLTQHVWETFTRVTTPAFATEVMSQYRVGDAPKSDTLAYVYQDDDPAYWVLAANLATSKNDSDLIATLVHEYAHILSLDGTQMTMGIDSCPTVELTEGCADNDSYLWNFEQQFWADYKKAPAVDNSDSDVGYDFYLKHEDDFVSDYAATNVVEDLAESFMTYVIEDEPSGTSVVAKKLEFFANYPELVTIRERIRTEFQVELGL